MMDTLSGAILSPCRLYRYLLWRIWAGPADDVSHPKLLLWIMLNPSTADSMKDDATIRVCRGRAIRLGYGGIVVANLFALRATHPDALYHHIFPVQERECPHKNWAHISAAISKTQDTICAWGRHGAYMGQGPLLLSHLHGMKLFPAALKLNADGSPAHPLRIPYSQPLVRI
jgi:hypothetical protein